MEHIKHKDSQKMQVSEFSYSVTQSKGTITLSDISRDAFFALLAQLEQSAPTSGDFRKEVISLVSPPSAHEELPAPTIPADPPASVATPTTDVEVAAEQFAAAMKAEIAKDEAAAPKRRGRPRKNPEATAELKDVSKPAAPPADAAHADIDTPPLFSAPVVVSPRVVVTVSEGFLTDETPVALKGATSLKEALLVCMDRGITDHAVILAHFQKYAADVPCIAKVGDALSERIARGLAVLARGA